MSRPARAACVLLTLLILVGGCGGKSKSTAYPVPPPAPPGEDKPSAEVSQNLAIALGPTSDKPATLEERRDKLPSELVGDRGNAVYSGERLKGSVTATAAASTPAPASPVPPAPVVAKAPPAVPRTPVERQAASVAPSAPVSAQPPASPAPAAPPVPPAPTANLSGGGQVTAQLAAFRTRANAEGGWQRLRAAHPDQLGDRALILQEADLGERGIYYRVRTGPFADIATAKAFCEQLRAREQACVVLNRQ